MSGKVLNKNEAHEGKAPGTKKEQSSSTPSDHIIFDSNARAAQVDKTKDRSQTPAPSFIDSAKQSSNESRSEGKECASSVYGEPAVTFWSYNIMQDGVEGHHCNFPMSSMRDTSRPFNRNSAFTNDVEDGRLHHSNATDKFVSD